MRSEQLRASGDASEYHQRHADYYLALAEQARPELFKPDGKRWLDRLEREHDNFRAAHRWSIENHDPELQARLATGLWIFRWMASLTPRELEVATLIARGMTSREIADALVISVHTADTNADRIRDKLGLRSRAEIALWAVRRVDSGADR